ncbi:MAG: TetR/AcrR family transcriptional regulator [Actinomycetia bacterium]|nr:TetR/AcrR family transcriptional regulator [Actinomycetes bacterium]
MPANQTRAKPMSPDDRRRAIVEAVIPLILDRGTGVTSREMAEAAGVAEGTIFSVFPDKGAILTETVKFSLDPCPVEQALADIPQSDPMEKQLESAVRILAERNHRFGSLMGVLRAMHTGDHAHAKDVRAFVVTSNDKILAALTELLRRNTDRLRTDPGKAAVTLRGFVFANAHPMMTTPDALSADQIVDMLMFGIADETADDR